MVFVGEVGEIIEVRKKSRELFLDWKIPHFRNLKAGFSDYYKSPLFSFCDTSWSMKVWPKNCNGLSNSVSFRVSKEDGSTRMKVYIEVGLRGSYGVAILGGKKQEFRKDNLWHYDGLFPKSLSEILLKDVLTVTCYMKISRNTSGAAFLRDVSIQTDEERREQNAEADGSQPLNKQGVEEWQNSLLKLLESGKGSDVVIKVKGESFPAHRLLLQARSPVFEAMFSHETAEKQSGTVTMEDTDPEILPDFLKYLYTGSTGMISAKNVFGLYVASDKYDLKTLKSECSEFMKRNLDIDSFCDAIALAVQYDEKELVQLASKFFSENTLAILKRADWQTFLGENPTVGNELFIKSYSKK